MGFGDGVGSNPGLQIWRIEDFEAVPYDEKKYGQFYTGDSYVVLQTTQKRSGCPKWNLFFWLGSETSQDEAGTAVIKTIELDDELGGAPVQYREVQGHESSLFESCFKKGIKYLPGGIKSGFRHVDPEDIEKRLFQVKGKWNIKVKQVELSPDVMNKSDCFILDLGKGHDILVYMPQGAKRIEKFKAIQAANEIKDEDHAGDAKVEIIDEFGGDQARFFEELGSGSPDDIPEESESDVEAEEVANRSITLYKISDNGTDDVEVTEITGIPLSQHLLNQDDLESQDCFILNTGSTSGVFAWIGKGASKEERLTAIKAAEKFLVKQGLPKWTRVERIVDGGETTMFKQYFKNWKEPEDSPYVGLGRVYPMEAIAEWDVASLHAENRRRLARAGGAAVGFMPDNSVDGDLKIWRIEDFEMIELDESLYGKLFGGDSYVLRYSYIDSNGPGHIIYFWQGAQSSQDEKAAAAICTVKVDNELGGKAVQVRVVQGREPRHFIKMFKGSMIVYSGGKASGFKNVHDHDTYDVDGTRMFRVRGTCADDVRAVQVPEVTASLNSEDVFILETPNATWIWNGRGSSEDECQIAVGMAEKVSSDVTAQPINEGEESEEFWAALGGQGDYSKEIDLDKPILEPRLFHCYTSPSGIFKAIEISDFTQDDLVSDDVMICDSGDEIYVWVGSEADGSEKEKGLALAKEYLAKDPTERNESNTLIFTVREGEEPSSFTCIFPSFTKKE